MQGIHVRCRRDEGMEVAQVQNTTMSSMSRDTSFWEKKGMQSSYELLSKIYGRWLRQIKSQKRSDAHTTTTRRRGAGSVEKCNKFLRWEFMIFPLLTLGEEQGLGEVKWWRWTAWRRARARPTVNHFVRFLWDNFEAQRKFQDSGCMRAPANIIRNMKYWS